MEKLKNISEFYFEFKKLEKFKIDSLVESLQDLTFLKPTVINFYYDSSHNLKFEINKNIKNVICSINFTTLLPINTENEDEYLNKETYKYTDVFMNNTTFDLYWTNELIDSIYNNFTK